MPGKLWVVPELNEIATLKDRMERCCSSMQYIPGVEKKNAKEIACSGAPAVSRESTTPDARRETHDKPGTGLTGTGLRLALW